MDVIFQNVEQLHAYPPNPRFLAWLAGETGRAAYFELVDPILNQALISKLKAGRVPITFEYAFRLERAQKPSSNPLKAIELMTFEVDQELCRYVTGEAPAPAMVKKERKPRAPRRPPQGRTREHRTAA